MPNTEHIAELEKDLAAYTAQKDQLTANLNATIGAIGALQRLVEREKASGNDASSKNTDALKPKKIKKSTP